MTQIHEGDAAPGFEALAVGGEFGPEGKPVTLAGFAGRRVVLYFYPKDDTPGCTTQACGLRDAWTGLEGQAQIFGVSSDDAESHRKFQDKHALPFPLLVDEGHRIAEAYGVWVEKSMYGKKYWGVERSTFVIGEEGRILAVARKVKPSEHADWLREVLG